MPRIALSLASRRQPDSQPLGTLRQVVPHFWPLVKDGTVLYVRTHSVTHDRGAPPGQKVTAFYSPWSLHISYDIGGFDLSEATFTPICEVDTSPGWDGSAYAGLQDFADAVDVPIHEGDVFVFRSASPAT